MDKRAKIIVILGPTSSGKSDVAIKLAQKFSARGGSASSGNGAEIISADSRQIYRGLDIGTGKVPKDRSKIKNQKSKLKVKNKKFIPYYSEGVAHYLIDIASPKTDYSAAKFKKDAESIIKDILKRNKLPIICGGTGFWIKAVVDNVNYPEVKPDWKLRNQLSSKSAEELFSMLKKLDPERAKNIDSKNKVRLIRAIEICKTLGKVPRPIRIYESFESTNSKFVNSHTFVDSNRNYEFLQIGINIPKEKLHENIKKRLQKRFKEGMIEEVEKLHKKHKLSWKKIESFGLGYFWIPKYLKREIKAEEELFEKVYQAEKDYAKRQMTWFRKDERIIWKNNYKEILAIINNLISK